MVGSIDLSPYGVDSLCCLKTCQSSQRSLEKLLSNTNCIPKFFIFYVFNVFSQKYSFAYKNIQLLISYWRNFKWRFLKNKIWISSHSCAVCLHVGHSKQSLYRRKQRSTNTQLSYFIVNHLKTKFVAFFGFHV